MTTAIAAAAEAPWVPDTSTFGARLALVRWRMGWNVAEAAHECGLLRQNWRLWEEGREPRQLTKVAMQIAGRTGVDYLWLCHGPGRGQMPRDPHEELVTHGYPQPTVEDREGRVLAHREVRHGDARRRVRNGAPVNARRSTSSHPTRSTSRPVSRLAVA